MLETNEKVVDNTVSQEKESSPPKKKTYEYKKMDYAKKDVKKAEIVLISKNYVIIKDGNGGCIRKYGSFPDVKVGDFIEI